MNTFTAQHKQDLERVARSKVGVRGGAVTPSLEFVPGRQQFHDYFGARGGENKSPVLSESVDTGGVSWQAGVRLSAKNTALVFSPAQVGRQILAGKRLGIVGREGWAVLWVTMTIGVRFDGSVWVYTGRDSATLSWRVLGAEDYEQRDMGLFGDGIVAKGTDGVLATVGPGIETQIQYGSVIAWYQQTNGRMTLESPGTGVLINASPNFSPYGDICFL